MKRGGEALKITARIFKPQQAIRMRDGFYHVTRLVVRNQAEGTAQEPTVKNPGPREKVLLNVNQMLSAWVSEGVSC